MGQRSGIAARCGLKSQTWLGSVIAVAVWQAGSCNSNSTPSLGTSICCAYSSKKEKKKSDSNYVKLFKEKCEHNERNQRQKNAFKQRTKETWNKRGKSGRMVNKRFFLIFKLIQKIINDLKQKF